MSKKGFAGFDPEGLERAAEAVRELSQFPHAQSVIQLQIKQQEAKAEEAKALQKDREIKKITHDHEERRKTLQKNLEINKETADYNDKLERKRHHDKLKQQDEFQEQQRIKQEEALKREEQLKRETMEHQLKVEEKRLIIKGKVDAEMYRKNHDLHRQELIMREVERRETYKQIFQLNFQQLSLGFDYLMNNPAFMQKFFLYTASITTAFYLSRHSIQLGSRYLESVIGKPSLIRETSKLSYKQFYKLPIKYYKQLTKSEQVLKKNIFQNIILAPELKNNLEIISHALINKRRHQAPLRNLLFYGPPGTGKTLFAQQLAHSSGLDFAIMTGSDIAPLGTQGVHELNKVFDWANKSSDGILLFIDEADAFFRKRENTQISENLRNSINSFLYRTGTPSKKVMVVLATNQPEQLDKAVQDRMDQVLNFDLPKLPERLDLLYLYLTKYCDPSMRLNDYLSDIWKNPKMIFTKRTLIRLSDDIDKECIEKISQDSKGFSAREIEKYIIACHDQAFSQEDPVLTKEMLFNVFEQAKLQHTQRLNWILENGNNQFKQDKQ